MDFFAGVLLLARDRAAQQAVATWRPRGVAGSGGVSGCGGMLPWCRPGCGRAAGFGRRSASSLSSLPHAAMSRPAIQSALNAPLRVFMNFPLRNNHVGDVVENCGNS